MSKDYSAGFVWRLMQGESKYSIGGWLFDDRMPPSAPIINELNDSPNVSNKPRLGRVSSVGIDKRPDGIRTGTTKQLKLAWPKRIDTRFWQYLRYKFIFGVPVIIDVPIMNPIDAEQAYTPDNNDEYYLYTYYGNERWWKDTNAPSTDVEVYLNGSKLVYATGGYTIDYVNGCVTFNIPKDKTDIVTLKYSVSIPFIITKLTPNFIPGFVDTEVQPIVELTEIASLT